MKTRFPSRKEIQEVLKELENVEGSRMLEENASVVDKMKFELCAQFIIYRREHGMGQKELADKLGIDQALMSKILRYRFDDFTLDRLIRYLEVLHKNLKIKIEAA